MGYMVYHAALLRCRDEAEACAAMAQFLPGDPLHRFRGQPENPALRFGLNVALPFDGSKEGWPESDCGDQNRKTLIAFARARGLPYVSAALCGEGNEEWTESPNLSPSEPSRLEGLAEHPLPAAFFLSWEAAHLKKIERALQKLFPAAVFALDKTERCNGYFTLCASLESLDPEQKAAFPIQASKTCEAIDRSTKFALLGADPSGGRHFCSKRACLEELPKIEAYREAVACAQSAQKPAEKEQTQTRAPGL